MLNLFKSLTNKKIILISVGLLLLMAVVVVLYAFSLINETFFLIGMFVLLMVFSSLTSQLWQRHFQKKMDNKKKGKTYTFNNELSFTKPLKTLKANFGTVDLYLEDKALYSLIKVNDVELFFSEDQQQIKFNIDKKKYDKLIQFYIFDTKDESLFRKISILNYQSKTFYVGSFIVNEISKTIYQTDNVKPNDEYQNLYNHFLELINVSLDQM